MTVQIANNAKTVLTADAPQASTLITVQDGSLFPALSGADTFPVTLISWDGRLEICRCTARAGNQLTVKRGQEGTAAQSFVIGDRVELRLTKGTWDERFAPLDKDQYKIDQLYAQLRRAEYGDGPYPVFDQVFGAGASFLDPRITHTRPGKSWRIVNGVIREYDVDEPCLTGDGLSLRPAETNLLTWSQDVSKWVGTAGATLSSSAEVVPGGIPCGELIEDTSLSLHYTPSAAGALTAGTKYTMSRFIKGMGRNVVFTAGNIAVIPLYSVFDTATGAFLNTNPAANTQAIALSGGWWWVSVSAIAAQSATTYFNVYLADGTNANYQGDGSSGVYISGRQVNQGDPIPYIPTTDSAVTRPADNASIHGDAFASVWNPMEGALVLDLVSSNNTAYNLMLDLRKNSNLTGDARLFVSSYTNTPYDPAGLGQKFLGPFDPSGSRIAFTWAANDALVSWHNGVKKGTTANWPTDVGSMKLPGSRPTNLRRLTIFTRRPSDAQMEAMTS